jgi:hypothetical protein
MAISYKENDEETKGSIVELLKKQIKSKNYVRTLLQKTFWVFEKKLVAGIYETFRIKYLPGGAKSIETKTLNNHRIWLLTL